MTSRETLALASRLVVGAVLVYAGASKAAAPAEEFALVISAYDLLPPSTALPAAGLLPWLELLVGWALILGAQTRLAAAAALGLAVVFLFSIGSVLLRGIPLPNCGCFGPGLHFSPGQTFVFDLILTALAWNAFRLPPGPASLDSWAERGQ